MDSDYGENGMREGQVCERSQDRSTSQSDYSVENSQGSSSALLIASGHFSLGLIYYMEKQNKTKAASLTLPSD